VNFEHLNPRRLDLTYVFERKLVFQYHMMNLFQNFAFKSNLRRYTEAVVGDDIELGCFGAPTVITIRTAGPPKRCSPRHYSMKALDSVRVSTSIRATVLIISKCSRFFYFIIWILSVSMSLKTPPDVNHSPRYPAHCKSSATWSTTLSTFHHFIHCNFTPFATSSTIY